MRKGKNRYRSISQAVRAVGQYLSEGLVAGMEIGKIRGKVSEKEIRGFKSMLHGYPIQWYNGTTKYDVIARLDFLMDIIRNWEDKYLELKMVYKAQADTLSDVMKENEQLQEELDSITPQHVYSTTETNILLTQADIVLDKYKHARDTGQPTDGTVTIHPIVLEAMMQSIRSQDTEQRKEEPSPSRETEDEKPQSTNQPESAASKPITFSQTMESETSRPEPESYSPPSYTPSYSSSNDSGGSSGGSSDSGSSSSGGSFD